jgi:L-lactate dehydrogenase complex protein LldG
MNDRRRILARVRAALAPLTTREPMPTYGDDEPVAHEALEGDDCVGAFVERVGRAGGRAFVDLASLTRWLVERGDVRGYCDPFLLAELGPVLSRELVLETRLVRNRIDDYRFGITRAAGAIAETGTVILDDATTSSRLAALAPWVHVAVVRTGTIHLRVIDAVHALGADPYVVWCTGPSKTADVEGILIEGVHGPGEQVVLVLPPPPEATG